MVSDAQGSPLEADPSVWTCMTNSSLIDDGFNVGEPQVCTSLGFGVSNRSEFDGSESTADIYDGDGLAFRKGHLYRGLRGQVEDSSTDHSDMLL